MSATMMRTSNPTLNPSVFQRAELESGHTSGGMTIQGAAIKTLILVAIVALVGAYVWTHLVTEQVVDGAVRYVVADSVIGFMLGGMLGGLVLGFVTVFRPQWSPVTAPLYAGCQGVAMGAVSALFEMRYPGIVVQAVTGTIGTLVVMMTVYATGLVKVTDKFRAGVVAATGAVCLVYLASWIMSLFGVRMSFLYDSSLLSIGISVVVIIIAALNLILDFDVIATCAEQGAPKFMEWYGGFSLLVTLIWLYLEILRLLAKTRGRN